MFEDVEHEGNGWWIARTKSGVVYEGDFNTDESFTFFFTCEMYFCYMHIAATYWEYDTLLWHDIDSSKSNVWIENKLQCVSLPTKKEICLAKLKSPDTRLRYSPLKQFIRAMCDHPDKVAELSTIYCTRDYYV